MKPGSRPSSSDSRPPVRESFSAVGRIARFLAMTWRVQPVYGSIILLARPVCALGPLAMLAIGKLLIDAVVLNAGAASPDWGYVVQLIALELAVAVTVEAFSRTATAVETLLGERFTNQMSIELMHHAAVVDLRQLEDPAFYDKLQRASRHTLRRSSLLTTLMGILQSSLTVLSLIAALMAYNVWLVLVLLLAIIPSFLAERHYAGKSYSMEFGWTHRRRELDYLRYLAADNVIAKEVKTFGLVDYLTTRYQQLADSYLKAVRDLLRRRTLVGLALATLSMLAYYGAVLFIVAQTILGVITLGTMTFLVGSFDRSRSLVLNIFMQLARVYEESLFLQDLFDFLAIEPSVASNDTPVRVPRTIRKGLRFEGVGFTYPNATDWALKGVSFELRPGERIALVGENGAGKTTLVKLLIRLYDPTAGRILLDDVDLRELDLDELRSRVGVIFQDYVRYNMKIRENVGVGSIQDVFDDEWLLEAAARSRATDVIDRLGGGLDHMLGRLFDGGADLSGGEWQKIALARAYVRRAELVVLDEPTAALDARAERAVSDRFDELTEGKMAVLISHGFSTVRIADRILVMENGEIIEQGAHAELLAKAGRYAELFGLQAEAYR